MKFCCFDSFSVSDFDCFNSLLTISSKLRHSNFWRFSLRSSTLVLGSCGEALDAWLEIDLRWDLLQRCPAITMCIPFFVKWWKGIKTGDDIEWYFLLPSWHINCFVPASSLQTQYANSEFFANWNRSLQELQVKLLVVLLAVLLLMRFQKNPRDDVKTNDQEGDYFLASWARHPP